MQLTNHNFATGTFTGWTADSGVTIQTTGGPDGAWARLAGSTSTLTSDAFSPEADAQAIEFDFGAFSTTGSNTVAVYVLTGATYSTYNAVGTLSCANCNQWSTARVGIGQWAGQSVKLRFERISGTIGIDRVTKRILFPGFTTSGDLAHDLDGSNPYANIKGKLTSSAFTVDSASQSLTVALRGLTAGSDQAYVKVLSGPTFSTVTTLVPTFADSWSTVRFNLASFSGQAIKLQLDVITGRVGVDDIGIMRIDAPSWTLGSGTITPVAGNGGGTALTISGTLTSSALTLPAVVQQLTIRYKTGSSGLYWELLTGPTYGTVVQLGLVSSPSAWATYRAAVSEWGGQSVKLRVRAQLAAVTVDDVGILETLIPGW